MCEVFVELRLKTSNSREIGPNTMLTQLLKLSGPFSYFEGFVWAKNPSKLSLPSVTVRLVSHGS